MKTTPTPGQILLIYSAKDESLSAWINSYLNEFKLKGIIQDHSTLTIEEITESSVQREQLKESRDVLLLLATPNLIKADFAQSNILQNLVTRHQLGRNLVLPLFFHETASSNNRLARMARLKTNTNTVVFNSISELHRQLIPIFQELENITINWFRYNDILDQSWRATKEMDGYEGYLSFQQEHKHSVYSQEAEARIKILQEEKLWKEALSFNTMEYYFRYLCESPLKKYEEACIKKILEFESKQEVAQIDALKNNNIALALNFKAKYDNRTSAPEIDKHLFQLFDNPTTGSQPIQTEGFFLQHQALKNCNPEEALSLQLSLQYDQHLKGRLRNVIGKFKSFQATYGFGMIVALIAFCWLSFFNTFSIFHTGKIALPLFIAYIVLAYIGYRCLSGIFQAANAIQKHQTILQQIEKDHIYLQVAAISKDQRQMDQILFNFANTNFNLIPYENINLFNFIALEEDMEIEKKLQSKMLQKV